VSLFQNCSQEIRNKNKIVYLTINEIIEKCKLDNILQNDVLFQDKDKQKELLGNFNKEHVLLPFLNNEQNQIHLTRCALTNIFDESPYIEKIEVMNQQLLFLVFQVLEKLLFFYNMQKNILQFF
jgi:hypothetical protein